MKTHTLLRDEVAQVILNAEVMVAHMSRADGLTKDLTWFPSQNAYKVSKNGEVIYETVWVDWAIEQYNRIDG